MIQPSLWHLFKVSAFIMLVGSYNPGPLITGRWIYRWTWKWTRFLTTVFKHLIDQFYLHGIQWGAHLRIVRRIHRQPGKENWKRCAECIQAVPMDSMSCTDQLDFCSPFSVRQMRWSEGKKMFEMTRTWFMKKTKTYMEYGEEN